VKGAERRNGEGAERRNGGTAEGSAHERGTVPSTEPSAVPPFRHSADTHASADPRRPAELADPLAPCVHCGFCLPSCPTYLATGDEADSPRGRIVLMRALERNEIGSGDDALAQHLDACLGCRGCEPVCPSGVEYGRGLEVARERLFEERGLPRLARTVLGVFRHEALWRPLFLAARAFRATGLPRLMSGAGRVRFGMAMLAASAERRGGGDAGRREIATLLSSRANALSSRANALSSRANARDLAGAFPGPADKIPRSARDDTAPLPRSAAARPTVARPTVALFRGCVMDTLFRHVNDATRRTLEFNGYEVIEVAGQSCCGALHEHAGDRTAAAALARRNVAALAGSADYIVTNSAGCGALLKDYGHLLHDDEEAAAFGAKVRDVSELLAAVGPRPGAPLELDVAYDAPCHLQHAQRVHDAPLAVLRAIPGLELRMLPGADRCCGSAGIYSVLRPAMARAVLASKIEAIAAAEPRPGVVATGNPGCLMQIGAGLIAAGLDIAVVHPVELLDESYRAVKCEA
jgi:glycolate oxidase iron-sulfur subunit